MYKYAAHICRTIPLRPEDYQRFKPELWVRRGHTPGRPVSFNDPALLRTELELRRRRELQRQSHHQNDGEEMVENNDEERASSFASLPWEEIVFGANADSAANMTTFAEISKKKKGKSNGDKRTESGRATSKVTELGMRGRLSGRGA